MTDAELQRLRALAQAATPGPWRDNHVGAVKNEAGRDIPITYSDAAFIAAARNAMPALLDEIDRLRAAEAIVRTLANQPIETTIPCVFCFQGMIMNGRRSHADNCPYAKAVEHVQGR